MLEILNKYLPSGSVAYCYSLWQQYQFDFIVKKPRQSRFGDFRWQVGKRDRITVNGDLNPYNFLITYLHEVAHLEVYRNYKKRPPAHGKAWKSHFQKLLQPVMTENNFPDTILIPLLNYSQNPTASTATYPPLMLALSQIDQPQDLTTVGQLPMGAVFIHGNKSYVRGALQRTRVLCTEEKSQRKYLFAAHAMVQKK